MYFLYLNIILSTCFLTHSFGFNGVDIGYRLLLEGVNLLTTVQVEQKTIEVPLDHFDANETRKWKMTYYQCLDFWKTGGPIYLFIGGESGTQTYFLKGGFMNDLAKETNGAMFMSEHRYYGDPKPVSDLNTDTLVYLSAKQALADLETLLKYIKSLTEYSGSKVVVVGGSYPGNLAAWMSLLYPEIVDAAISSSAPALAKLHFYEYLETIEADIKEYGTPDCYDKISKTFKRYNNLFQTRTGIEQFKKEENICSYSDMTKPENQDLFVLLAAIPLMSAAQYGTPKNIKKYCEQSGVQKVLSTLKHIINTAFWDTKEVCHNFDIKNIVNNWKGTLVYQWTYQTCTEFGYFMTTASSNQPFSMNISADLYFKICSLLFGSGFNENTVDQSIKNNNQIYGGLTPRVTQVVYVNGDMDPWHGLGILKDLSDDAPARLVKGTSHCQDLIPRPDDPQEMIDTRNYVKQLIKKWIQ